MKNSVRTVTFVVVGVVLLTVAGWIVALVLFKAGETSNPPRTIPVTTAQG
ncbi:MAG: hypothetical protein QOF45_232 [Gaiellaceae bacterium]|nr:hypothetical protein [Gaiellaceae bacterium]